MRLKELTYITDLEELFRTYDELLETDVIHSTSNNPYKDFLLANGLIIESSDKYVPNKKHDLSKESSRDKIFLEFLEEYDEKKHICELLSDNPITLDEIERQSTGFDHPALRTILAWLERLKCIKVKSDGYVISDEMDESTDDYKMVYPLDINSVYDIKNDKFSAFEFDRRIEQGKININPDFQRHFVWKEEQMSRFIESMILQIPMAPIYLKKMNDGTSVIVDGLQRTTTLQRFLKNKFSLKGLQGLVQLNGKKFSDLKSLGDSIVSRIEDTQFIFYTLQPSVPMSAVYDIFNRINTGGTILERQEIRNCIYIGKSTRLLKNISENNIFKESIDNGIKALRMKDQESILRCLSFVLFSPEVYNGSMDEHMERTMKYLNSLTGKEIDDIKQSALSVFKKTKELFQKRNFRVPTENSRGRINIAVMESVFKCFWKATSVSSNINEGFEKLLHDEVYIDSVKSSTGSKSKVEKRFAKAGFYLDKYIKK